MPYVYQYVDCITKLPFYVGKGTGKRRMVHLWEAKSRIEIPKKGRPSYCIATIVKMLRENNPPSIEIIADGLTHDEAFAMEEKLVKQHGRKGLDEGGILTNRALGGRGGRGYKQTPEMIAALVQRNHQQKGKPKPGMSAYIRENPDSHWSRRQTGIPQSESRKAANAKTQREKQIGAKIMTFQSPEGEIFCVKDWQSFMAEKGLSYNLVRAAGKPIPKGPNAGWALLAKERFYTSS